MAARDVAGPQDALAGALERLYGRERGNKGPFTLEGTRLLLDALGHPEKSFASIHVAGTNGKGSTCALIERGLRAAGYRTGLFTSPHLVDFRERIRLDGRWADSARTAERLDRIAALPAARDRTYFEVTFALAALTFAEEGVEWAVIETGLGGRLDATNVVESTLTVITPVGMDHMELLGDTIEAIAAEKAGILKPGVPLVLAPQDPRADAVIRARADELGVRTEPITDRDVVMALQRMDRTGSDLELDLFDGPFRAHVGLLGRHQWANALTAARALDQVGGLPAAKLPDRAGERPIRGTHVAEGFAAARWPGRFERSRSAPWLWWDGAHNAEGARALRTAWREVLEDPPVVLVLGFASDKDGAAIVEALRGPVRTVVAVAARAPRAVPAEEVARIVRDVMPGVRVTAAADVSSGVALARAAAGPGGYGLACGSLFVVGEAMRAVAEGGLECL